MSDSETIYIDFLKLEDKKRLEKILEILDYYVAGEYHNKLLVFFLMLGNLHKKYKSFVIYRGDPGGGKNVVTNNVLKLFPPKKIYVLDGATAKALNYDETIKEAEIVYLRELEQHESVITLLKGLYNADGRIFKETIQEKDTKAHYVKHHEIDQKGIITTFSFETIAPDIISRSWVINPDQSYKQTRNVVSFYVSKEEELIEKIFTEKEMRNRCYFISKCIEQLDFEYEVYIPYVKKLEVLLPDIKLNVRRDRAKLFNIIKIITLWNQYNRRSIEIKGYKFLFSEYTDLRVALEVCELIFINMILQLDDIKKMILNFIDKPKLVKTGKKKEKKVSEYGELNINQELLDDNEYKSSNEYSVTDIFLELNKETSISRKTVKRKLDDLFMEGYLQREKKGTSYIYTLIKKYNIIEMLNLNEIEEEINQIVDDSFEFYTKRKGELENESEE